AGDYEMFLVQDVYYGAWTGVVLQVISGDTVVWSDTFENYTTHGDLTRYIRATFNVPSGSTYTFRIINSTGHELRIYYPCIHQTRYPTASPEPTGTGTPTPWWSGPSTPTPGYSSPAGEPGFCDGAAPKFPGDTGECQQSGNWWEYPAIWLCNIWSLIQRLFTWLGWLLEWLLCPVYDVFAWIQCLWSILAQIWENLLCIIRQPFEFIWAAWHQFTVEVTR